MSEDIAMEDVVEVDALQEALDAAGEEVNTEAAIKKYSEILTGFEDRNSDEIGARCKEEAIYKLARLYATEASRVTEIVGLLNMGGTFFGAIAKAKTAKIVRGLLDIASEIPGSLEVQAELCRQIVAWCKQEKRTFLRQRVESRLVSVDYERGRYDEALVLVNRLLKELKKLDDKQMLVESHLIEAKIHAALRNVPKSKAALTAARTNGNAVYVGPVVQAQLDEMSGTLHCEESDYATSYSYFLEAFEAYDTLDDTKRAAKCLKYMLLCQILDDDGLGDVNNKATAQNKKKKKHFTAIQTKHQLKYAGSDLDSMAAVAKAAKTRSLDAFEAATATYAPQLNDDLLVKHHLDQLYDHILERNLTKIIEPFSRCEIDHIATLIDLPPAKVEHKLAQMILDKKLNGTLAQGTGHLIVHAALKNDPTYQAANDLIKNMGDVVTSLFKRADSLDA
uniref:PCI domain-containing protein n=1 Tax=Aureoumbra lagunensis TaxID=44058 RepID=A0A7S3K5Y2_9STRA|mmetsp:Transcript_13858/g.20774  ORF Transcript_13858/g.20774 Transcript_13858/m.20774 type:complete len:450 (+) Transcript_13858:16-1365(+)|eukprot:CAMPEP_0197315388 /NCGR_PEP_ID=MMETSP0891-20130614/38024_1 /TAXON_ID=44058 ORGANISM="Aureoumbra lagunensis, Strain CCMP1510" /NCGR_SAMPLE_ID=MMETSP0891 /ASSEMBLY_ACC=CAM_ASM_000534 /LENGTH=449 /DNA_ID=CAMNT_0042804313 /DNA_START=15 /DNA_END=1364 /DNA_ORIENTATION=+